jgi:hypothetical protein
MAHFARLDENNIVTEVIVVNNSVLLDENGVEQESLGIEFLTNWSGGHTNWKQCSYNCSFRKIYPGVGCSYDPNLDIFIEIQHFPSWILNTDTGKWDPPIPVPSDAGEKSYEWNEQTLSWDPI